MSFERKRLTRALGVVYFIQLAFVLYAYMDAAGIGSDEAYSVFGVTEVGLGSSAWFRMENASMSSGRLRDPGAVRVEGPDSLVRKTIRTQHGAFDLIEVPDVQGGEEVTFAVEGTDGEWIRHAEHLSVRPGGRIATFWGGEPERRQFHSVVAGYEREGIEFRNASAEPGFRLQIGFAGGNAQALMENEAHLLFADSEGLPISDEIFVVSRRSLDGVTEQRVRTDALGLARVTFVPRHAEDWTVMRAGGDEETIDARMVPSRDGIQAFATSSFVDGAAVELDLRVQGSRSLGFVRVLCSDGTNRYSMGRLGGGDSRAQLELPVTSIEGLRACEAQIATGAGYAGAPRASAPFLAFDSSSARLDWENAELIELVQQLLARPPFSLGSTEATQWLERVRTQDATTQRRFLEAVLTLTPHRYRPLPRLYSSRDSVAAGATEHRDRVMKRLRWMLVMELVAGVALILLFVIPEYQSQARARERYIAGADEEEDVEAAASLTRSSSDQAVFWGLLAAVLLAVVAGFVFLLTVIG